MTDTDTLMVGWCEWVVMPALGVPAIRAKIDTGARTSALHAVHVERYRQQGKDRVRFEVEPLRRYSKLRLPCDTELIDQRTVRDSGGHTEERLVIRTTIQLQGYSKSVELTLTERPHMRFRMLLGRTSMVPDIIVNPALSYHLGGMRVKTAYADHLNPHGSESLK